MKHQSHKHRESFSILLISNIGQGSRQFHISLFTVRLLLFILLLLLAALGWLSYQFSIGHREQEVLRSQLDSQTELVAQLETEKEILNSEKLALTAENETLRQTMEDSANEETGTEPEPETESGPEPETDPAIPSRYPCSGSGIMTDAYSEEHPYVSINTQTEGQILAAGNGTVTMIGSDDTYPVIIEIDHGNGYRTRYMCRQEAGLQSEEGAQVHAGDTLITVSVDNTLLDYQIFLNGELIDPLTIIEAKG